MEDEAVLSPYYTDQQLTILRVIPRVSGAISFLCSALIVGTILIPGDRQARLTHMYQRLLLALSSADLIFSLNYILGWHLLDSNAGCQMNGFLKAFGVSTAIYNACLCLHFFLTIGFQWTPRKFRESRFEIIFHILAIAWPLVLNTVGASLGLFIGGEGTIPAECVYDAFVLGLFAWFVPESLSTLLVIATMAGILWCVCRQERKSARYRFQPAEQDIQTTQSITTPTTTTTKTRSRLRRESNYRRTREAAKQAALFITAHLLTFGPKMAISVLIYFFPEQKYYGSVPLFVTVFIHLLFVPLQGFWNFCIYVRPRYSDLRRRYPDEPFYSILYQAIFPRKNPRNDAHSKNKKENRICKADKISHSLLMAQLQRRTEGETKEQPGLNDDDNPAILFTTSPDDPHNDSTSSRINYEDETENFELLDESDADHTRSSGNSNNDPADALEHGEHCISTGQQSGPPRMEEEPEGVSEEIG